MSNDYTVIAKGSDFQQLLTKLQCKGINLQNNLFRNSQTSLDSSDDKKCNLKMLIDDYGEFIDYCIYKSFKLLEDFIKHNCKIKKEQKDASMNILYYLKHNKEFCDHLVISTLYTVRYLLSHSYMIMHNYIYCYSNTQRKECFWDKKHLDLYTNIEKKNSKIRKPN